MSRSSAANASRTAQQSSQRAAQQAARSSSMKSSANASKYRQSTQNMRSQSRSLMAPRRPYSSGAPYTSQYMATSYYNNWLYFYIIASSSHDQQAKKDSVRYQMNMLKQQMKSNEKLYTVTVQTKKGKRVIVVPKNNTIKLRRRM